MKNVFLLIFIILQTIYVNSQIQRCPSGYLSSFTSPEYISLSKTNTLNLSIPVAFHIIHSTNGTGNLSSAVIINQIDVLNNAFLGSGISFYLISIDRTANNSWFYNLTAANPASQTEINVKQSLSIDPLHVLNIYTADVDYLGCAQFPWIFTENSYMHGVVLYYRTLPGQGAGGGGYDYSDGDSHS